ncbi:MAG TPA: hypothetical protein PKE06_22270 [Flavilitoribacter sp.]|nr:hypothetical protein [Flavilitoribacter sp.]HMQ87434.1 hypothetical protein [Flavilitoribacter sp.]
MNLDLILHRYGLSATDLFVWLFVPYKITADGPVSEFYDDPDTRTEMADAFADLGLDWSWTPITLDNLEATTADLQSRSDGRLHIVFNYCDGDEINGYPGLTVVKLLESRNIPFTGADSGFYHMSTSKHLMKDAFLRSGVPTAPYHFIDKPDTNLDGVCQKVGAPVFVKPSVSGGSFGLTWESVVHNDRDLQVQAARLFEGMHGYDFSGGGILAERFILGRDFTVLIAGTPGYPDSATVFPALQIVYDSSLPEERHHFVFDMWKEQMYVTAMATPEESNRLEQAAWAAYKAVGGTGYGRVDIRWEKHTDELFVLEVNANCSISSWVESDTICGKILQAHGYTFSRFIGDIIGDCLERHFSKPGVSPATTEATGL